MNWTVGRAALVAALAVGLAALTVAPAMARTNRALIVAVSDYPALPEKDQLNGPRNDALLVHEYLLHAPLPFAETDIRVLASGRTDADLPTRANILAALDQLAQQSNDGDFVYLHFSGHGAQEPALRDASEPDELDEIFLPTDVGKWDSDKSAVPNALVDNDIGDALDGIRDKGAFVWAVFDACHSGSATRDIGNPDLAQSRLVSAEDLGIPAELMAERVPVGDGARHGALEVQMAEPAKQGGLVAFYAAQSTERTPEMLLPKRSGDPAAESIPRQIYGLFTFSLMTLLARYPDVTYRQLSELVLQDYSARDVLRPTPLFEGDLDAPVFATEGGGRVLQWPIEKTGGRLTLQAGLMNGISVGTELLVMDNAALSDGDARGWLRVIGANNFTSELEPIDKGGAPALTLKQIPKGALARLQAVDFDFELTVARPRLADDNTEQVVAINAALDAIATDASKPLRLKLVDADQSADLRIAALSGSSIADLADPATADAWFDDPVARRLARSKQVKLWFLPPSGELSLLRARQPPSMDIDASPEALLDTLSRNLISIFRANAIARLASGNSLTANDVGIAIKVKHENDVETVEAGTTPLLGAGDVVSVVAENRDVEAVDVNVLYIGSDYSISAPADGRFRLNRGEKIDAHFGTITASSQGMERIVVVLTEARGSQEDLSYLERPGIPSGVRDMAQQSGWSNLLRGLGGGATRAITPLARADTGKADRGAVLVFPVEVRPR